MRIIVIFILMFVSSGAFAGNPIKRADSLLQKVYNKVDYDTTYISRSPGKIGLKLWGSLSGSRLKARGDNLNSTLRPDMKGSVSLEFDYYDLAIELATNVTGSSGSKRDFSINCNFYPRRFILDISYQKTWSASGSVTYNGQTVDVEADWLVTKMLNIDAYYTFNYRKFSYDSPFYQFYVQKKSAGSWQVLLRLTLLPVLCAEEVSRLMACRHFVSGRQYHYYRQGPRQPTRTAPKGQSRRYRWWLCL